MANDRSAKKSVKLLFWDQFFFLRIKDDPKTTVTVEVILFLIVQTDQQVMPFFFWSDTLHQFHGSF
jgi:hypothetical protein